MSGKLFFVCTSESGMIEQYELIGNGLAGITATKVRTLVAGKCEGAVADDEYGTLYISEEKKGVWRFDAEPDATTTGALIAAVGDHGLKGDVEGLTIVRGPGEAGFLLVSDQGRNHFKAYQRKAPHLFVGDFPIEGASQTDGIDLCQANLGPQFPAGTFACHTDLKPRWVLLTPLQQILSQLDLEASKK